MLSTCQGLPTHGLAYMPLEACVLQLAFKAQCMAICARFICPHAVYAVATPRRLRLSNDAHYKLVLTSVESKHAKQDVKY